MEASLHKMFSALVADPKSPVRDFKVVRGRAGTANALPSTRSKPSFSGIKEIDEAYMTLDYEHGQTFLVKLQIFYR